MILLAILSIFAIVLVGAMLLALQLRGNANVGAALDRNWLDTFSVERYRPMQALLSGADLEFLRARPGFTMWMEMRVRMQRARIFKAYLKNLDSDFQRLSAACKQLIVHANYDRPDLATVVLRRQLAFKCAKANVELRLLFYRCGVCGVAVKGLLHTFDSMSAQVQSLSPIMGAAAA